MLASLFLMWGREAFHLTQLLTEPVYFVSGLNFPVASLGFLGALALATIPLAVGLDAMRQLAFVGRRVPGRHAAARRRGADPRGHDRRVPRRGPRWMLRKLERMARQEGRLSVRWQ